MTYRPYPSNARNLRELWYSVSRELTRLGETTDTLTQAGYAAIRQTSSVGLSDIAPGVWETLPVNTGSDTGTQRGAAAVVANDSIRFDESGVWFASVALSMDFTEINQGRTFQVRSFNIASSTPGRTIPIAVGRNQSGVNWSIGFLLTVSDTDAGGEVRFEVGDASVLIGGVTLVSYTFDVFRVSGSG